jgi:hypothetical protein
MNYGKQITQQTHLLMWLIAKSKRFFFKKLYIGQYLNFMFTIEKNDNAQEKINWAFPGLFWCPLKLFSHLKGFQLFQVYVKMSTLQCWLVSFGAYIIAFFFLYLQLVSFGEHIMYVLKVMKT